MTDKYYIGMDIGGTKSAVTLCSRQGEILRRDQFSTREQRDWKSAVDQLKSLAAKFMKLEKIEAIGISCGGPLDSQRGVILSPPNLPGWDEVPVVEIFRSAFELPTYLENDANAGALAEWTFGAGRGFRNIIFLTFGTGCGAGLILDGKLYRGSNDLAGEVGHVRLADDGPIGFHKRGSFEGFCSGQGIAQMMSVELLCVAEEIGYHKMLNTYKAPGEVTGKDVIEWALRGDALAAQVIEKSARYLGKGISILIDILNPELTVIGGMGVRLGELLFKPAREVIEKEAISAAAEVHKIVPAELGEKIGDYAALCVAMRNE